MLSLTAMKPLRLRELIHPLSVNEFIRDYWLPRVPYVSEPNPTLLEKVAQVSSLRSGASLIGSYPNEVHLFGKKFRASVPSAQALGFVQQGYTAYMPDIELANPSIFELCEVLSLELGVPEASVSMEAFYAESGALSSGHYDHDVNFQILLSGEKIWRLAPNNYIRNPLRPYHPRKSVDGFMSGFSEEAYALDPSVPIPLEVPKEGLIEKVVKPGSVVFLPRGYWHEVEMLSASFAVNVVFQGLTWASAISAALGRRMVASELGREYLTGGLSTIRSLSKDVEGKFAAAMALARAELDRLSMGEAFLATTDALFTWTSPPDARELREFDDHFELHVRGIAPIRFTNDALLLMKHIAAFKHPFNFSHLVTVMRDELHEGLTPQAVWNMLIALTKEKLLSRSKAN